MSIDVSPSLKNQSGWMLVAHASDSSYLGDWNWEGNSLKPTWGKSEIPFQSMAGHGSVHQSSQAMQEAMIGMVIPGQSGQNVCKIPSQKEEKLSTMVHHHCCQSDGDCLASVRPWVQNPVPPKQTIKLWSEVSNRRMAVHADLGKSEALSPK
jgi:hypothetical protein